MPTAIQIKQLLALLTTLLSLLTGGGKVVHTPGAPRFGGISNPGGGGTVSSTTIANAGGILAQNNLSDLNSTTTALNQITGGVTATSSSFRIGANATSTSGSFVFSTSTALSTSTSLAYTGATSTYTVPSGVNWLVLTTYGGAGGAPVNAAGLGGVATGTLAVSPGQTYFYNVGGAGSSTVGGTGGFGGGGKGGGNGGGGGGMSWFSASPTFSTTTALIVGAGGGLTGTAGGSGAGTPAGGGTQTAGGVLGSPSGACIGGVAGSAGQGGSIVVDGCGAGGGGGGGFFGGGAGGTASGNVQAGGGGSSYVSTTLSSLIVATSTASGVQSGNGQILISGYTQTGSSTITSGVPVGFAVGSHIISGQPQNLTTSVSSCGTNPTFIGNDTAGTITAGTGGITACTLTFAQSWNYAPVCTASVASSTAAYAYFSSAISKTAFTAGLSSTMQGGTQINYHCFGY